MTTTYVRSTDGNNADTGATWALAKANLEWGTIGTGDTVYVSQVHAESSAASININITSVPSTSPAKILCGNDAAQPPTAVATTASVTTTGATNIIIGGAANPGNAYFYGIKFSCGTGAVTGLLEVAGNAGDYIVYEKCQFILGTSGASSQITANTSVETVAWKNCDVKFGAAGQSIAGINLAWDGGSVLSGGTSPTALIVIGASATASLSMAVRNVDLSNLSSGANLIAAGQRLGVITFSNCKLPSGWTGSLCSGSLVPGTRFSLYNCDSAGTIYKLWIKTFAGDIRDETTLVRTGGASNGSTVLSWKMVATANAKYPWFPLESDPIVIWNSTTGSSKTVTVEVLQDSATALTNGDIWLEVDYYGASGNPQGTKASSCVADVLTSTANISTSTATWTTTGMANPNPQKLSVTFTPQLAGYFLCKVMLAKASATVYVDPRVSVA